MRIIDSGDTVTMAVRGTHVPSVICCSSSRRVRNAIIVSMIVRLASGLEAIKEKRLGTHQAANKVKSSVIHNSFL